MLKKIYYSKWFPRLFYVKPDGGKYPIRIQQVWGDGTYNSETFDVDSICGDTLWKDGNSIKSNNIKNIKFN
jgi:hypothetical protein